MKEEEKYPSGLNTIVREDFINLMTDLAKSVYDFHVKFNLLAIDTHDYINKKTFFDGRIRKMLEELGEFSNSLNKGRPIEDTYLEIIDSLFVSMGTSLVIGKSLERACQTVINKNNNKQSDYYVGSE